MRGNTISRIFEMAVASLALAGLLTLPLWHVEAAEQISGQWLAEPSREGGHVMLTLQRSVEGRNHHMSMSDRVSASELRGLDWSAATSASGASVRFQIVRDAGTFDCDGWFKNGKGSGQFVFTPNPSFVSELAQYGYENVSAEKLLVLAMQDMKSGYLSEMASLGYTKIPFDQLVAFVIHGVTTDFVRDFGGLGYDGIESETLLAMRIHGVSSDYVREMQPIAGDRPPLQKLIAFRIHGVDRKFAGELAELGYTQVDPNQLVAMKIHGVSPEFIRDAKARKGAGVTLDDMIRMRVMGDDE